MTVAQKVLRERLQQVLGTMVILESEIHTIYHIGASNEGCHEEGKQALHQQHSLRKEIKTLRKFLEPQSHIRRTRLINQES